MNKYIIGVVGGSGAGKTTFIKSLRNLFSKGEICILSQDNYYLAREKQHKDSNGVINFDLPSAIDQKKMLSDIDDLVHDKEIIQMEYGYSKNDTKIKQNVLIPAPIIVIEGLYIFWFKKIYPLLDFKIFIDTKDNLKLIRRINRDGTERNEPISEVLYRYENHVLPSYEAHVHPFKEKADIIINNNEGFENALEFVKNSIRYKYLQTKM